MWQLSGNFAPKRCWQSNRWYRPLKAEKNRGTKLSWVATRISDRSWEILPYDSWWGNRGSKIATFISPSSTLPKPFKPWNKYFQLTDTFSGNFFRAPDKIFGHSVPGLSAGDLQNVSIFMPLQKAIHSGGLGLLAFLYTFKFIIYQFTSSTGQMSDVRRYFKAYLWYRKLYPHLQNSFKDWLPS